MSPRSLPKMLVIAGSLLAMAFPTSVRADLPTIDLAAVSPGAGWSSLSGACLADLEPYVCNIGLPPASAGGPAGSHTSSPAGTSAPG